ncbi:MAG: adenylate/guanylate cyclase domain-containing protein [Betaproteobacteria bacterium]|nr:adenylate/guanylate cyclase domain-containing protein [Betaproteobacteria bacterium]
MDDKENPAPQAEESADIEKLLEEKERIEKLMQDKFTRVLSVMFTDLKGSTAIAESEGDMAARMLLKQVGDILQPAIRDNGGTLVKTIGDGSLSYFNEPASALRAAIVIQKGIDALNMQKTFKTPVLLRVGIHTGKCIQEKGDIYGDTVNTASRFESTANAGEICISEETYNMLPTSGEFRCRYARTTQLKGKKEPAKVYKVYWNPLEVESDEPKPAAEKKKGWGIPLWLRIVLIALVPFIVTVAFMQSGRFIGTGVHKGEAKRSIEHSVTEPARRE